MATKVATYVMSEQFHKDVRDGLAEAVAKTRAAGLPLAGDSRIKKPSTRPATVVTIAAPTRTPPKRKTLRAA